MGRDIEDQPAFIQGSVRFGEEWFSLGDALDRERLRDLVRRFRPIATSSPRRPVRMSFHLGSDIGSQGLSSETKPAYVGRAGPGLRPLDRRGGETVASSRRRYSLRSMCLGSRNPVLWCSGTFLRSSCNSQHFIDVFKGTNASAALAAGIFHREEVKISEIKDHMVSESIPTREESEFSM